MRVAAAILAAGRSTRAGFDKTLALIDGRPVWEWSVQAYLGHPLVDEVFVVCSSENRAALSGFSGSLVLGGDTRQVSAGRAVDFASGFDALLLHDAARPFVSSDVISRVVEAVRASGAAAAAVKVTDTIKQFVGGSVSTLDRSKLYAMQTPQGALLDILRRAHDAASSDATDDLALIEAIGVQPVLVEGDPRNYKITTAEDYLRAKREHEAPEIRTGFGYDIHPFSNDPGRELWLGGVRFESGPGLEGHSDADVLLHAITDALLGAAGLGDIGLHFPNTDPQWKGRESVFFLSSASRLLSEAGWRVVNVDATVVAETPKVMPRSLAMRQAIAGALGVAVERVNVKATTNEMLGAIGRKEGIAAFATATIARLG